MKRFERYFSRNREAVVLEFPAGLELLAVIPVLDDPDVWKTLRSLAPGRPGKAGAIVVVNHAAGCPEEVKERNGRMYWELLAEAESNPFLQVIRAFDLPDREAGVGTARKIGMDAAALYFWKEKNGEGVIASLDADTLTEENYTEALLSGFRNNRLAGVTLAYAHRTEPGTPPVEAEAICRYELYLRYYRLALQYTGHPYAYTCLGSAFAVRAADYAAEGGMNRRQAGEDFYFLQKLIATGRFAHLNTTCVHPSARISFRTPFGTGQAVARMVKEGGAFTTYSFDAFRCLKSLFDSVDGYYKAGGAFAAEWVEKQPEALRVFLRENDLAALLEEVNANSASPVQFRKRFFDGFNAFRVLKFLNRVHPACYRKEPVEKVARELLAACGRPPENGAGAAELLERLRELDM
ncbi:MAG: hypothetical protein LBR65_07795 [Culturomica sp.]|jgi:hypothetical protein|nr:hypothetical protein [Culturomica sp.]